MRTVGGSESAGDWDEGVEVKEEEGAEGGKRAIVLVCLRPVGSRS